MIGFVEEGDQVYTLLLPAYYTAIYSNLLDRSPLRFPWLEEVGVGQEFSQRFDEFLTVRLRESANPYSGFQELSSEKDPEVLHSGTGL